MARTQVERATLVDVAPGLAERLGARDRASEDRVLDVAVFDVDIGPWQPKPLPGLGLLVTSGVIVRRAYIGGRAGTELLTTGDLLRPGQEEVASFSTPEWEVLASARLAVLEDRVATAMASWPALADYLLEAAVRRTRALVASAALQAIIGIEKRLLALLWILAERDGQVTPEGVVVDLPLTHQHLAELAGSRRPSVTGALSALRKAGLVEQEGRRWLLRGSPPEEFFRSPPAA